MPDSADKQPKLYQQIADAIADAIRKGVYARGKRLPSERDLAEEFKVSRPTVREAMIALEIRGLVEARQGSGIYVTESVRPPAEAEAPPELDIGAFELTEARRMFEGETAALAATVITDEEIAALEALMVRMEDKRSTEADVNDADREFHVAIARATRNTAIVSIVETLWDMRHSSILCRAMLERAAVRPVAQEHRFVFEAIKSRDPHKARQAMRSHLDHVIDALFEATEIDSVERAKSDVKAKRSEYVRRTAI